MSRAVLTLAILCVLCSALTAQNYQALSYLTEYTAFFETQFSSFNVDNQGRLAAGGTVNLFNYGVATELPQNCASYGLVAGTLQFTNGAVNSGQIIYANTASLSDVTYGCGATQAAVIDFPTAFSQLNDVSQSIAALPVVGTVTQQFSALTITGTALQNSVVVDAQTLASVSQITLDVPPASWLFITVSGEEVSIGNLQISTVGGTNVSYVLWNMPAAQSLKLFGVSVQGSVLAPHAAVQFDDGNIDGSFAAQLFNGTGELHYYPYVPPSSCVCPVCPPALALPDVTMFVRKFVNLSNTDNQGALYAGSDVALFDYAVGTLLSPSATQDVLVVGGDLRFINGEVENGNGVVAGSATLSDVSVPDGQLYTHTPTGIDFPAEFDQLQLVAAYLAALPSTGATVLSNTALSMSGSSALLNVFNVTTTQLSAATSWSIAAPVNSFVVVNVAGGSGGVQALGMELVGVQNTTVLLNFYEAASLTITAVSVQGSVLAPSAVVEFSNANIDGNLYCVSVFGDGEIHLAPLKPLPPPTCPPCDC